MQAVSALRRLRRQTRRKSELASAIKYATDISRADELKLAPVKPHFAGHKKRAFLHSLYTRIYKVTTARCPTIKTGKSFLSA